MYYDIMFIIMFLTVAVNSAILLHIMQVVEKMQRRDELDRMPMPVPGTEVQFLEF